MNNFTNLHDQKTCKKPKILIISSAPITPYSSGYHVKGRQPIIERLTQIYDVVPWGWTRRRELPISFKHVYLLDGLPIFLGLTRCILRGRFDVIITTGIPVLESIPAFILAKLLRIPIIVRETHWYWPNTLVAKLAWPINKLMCSNATLVICPGKRAYTYWRLLGIPKEKIKIVHFYTSVLQPTPENVEFAKRLRAEFDDKVIVLYFGRLIKKKGVDYLIKAFAKLEREFENIVLIIAGDGPERQNLENLCGELKVKKRCFYRGYT
ncbi:glycosyltransferase [Thermosphaera chiliense]|uniref:Glycosyltransferase n=1 Tax=Thermosphaera chiliense TaxID=3402707 RepID=A0A7M1URA4_9CREN|nr:glycosyltransferase [Thermosphaera aggregans]